MRPRNRFKLRVFGEKRADNVLVFPLQDGTGRVDERAALLYILCTVCKDSRLNLRQSPDFVRILEPDFGFLADNAQSRAGHVAQHNVRAVLPFLAADRCVLQLGADIRQSEAGCAVADALQLVLVNIARGDAAFPLHFFSHGKALAAGRRAAVEHGAARFRVSDRRRECARRILHGHAALDKRRKRGCVSAAAQQDFRECLVRLHGQSGSFQLCLSLGRRAFHRVHAHRNRRVRVIRLTDFLRQLLAVLLGKQTHEPLRVAVLQRVVAFLIRAVQARQRAVLRRICGISQHRIGKGDRAVICVAVVLDQRDRLGNRRMRGNLIHQDELIQTHPQARQHTRRDLFQPHAREVPQVPVQ